MEEGGLGERERNGGGDGEGMKGEAGGGKAGEIEIWGWRWGWRCEGVWGMGGKGAGCRGWSIREGVLGISTGVWEGIS